MQVITGAFLHGLHFSKLDMSRNVAFFGKGGMGVSIDLCMRPFVDAYCFKGTFKFLLIKSKIKGHLENRHC